MNKRKNTKRIPLNNDERKEFKQLKNSWLDFGAAIDEMITVLKARKAAMKRFVACEAVVEAAMPSKRVGLALSEWLG